MSAVQRDVVRVLLEQARQNLDSAEAWATDGHFDLALKHQQQAEGQCAALEIADCGSVGGFGGGTREPLRGGLRGRIEWLQRKYGESEPHSVTEGGTAADAAYWAQRNAKGRT